MKYLSWLFISVFLLSSTYFTHPMYSPTQHSPSSPRSLIEQSPIKPHKLSFKRKSKSASDTASLLTWLHLSRNLYGNQENQPPSSNGLSHSDNSFLPKPDLAGFTLQETPVEHKEDDNILPTNRNETPRKKPRPSNELRRKHRGDNNE